MANKNSIVVPAVSGSTLRGAAKTASFTTDGMSFNVSGQRVGIWLDLTITGTSPTLNIDVEHTMDGTTWGAVYPTTFATQDQADLDQITTTGVYFNWFENGIPFGMDTNHQIRLECTIAGTNPSFTFNEAKVVCWTPD